MKVINIAIDKGGVLDGIKRITANAAQQRGDDLHVATDDNEDLLDGFYDEVVGEIVVLLSRYASEGFVFTMPENWDVSLEASLAKRVNDAVVFGVLAKWYSLSGESIYGSMFEGTIEEIIAVLDKRVKPVRDGR